MDQIQGIMGLFSEFEDMYTVAEMCGNTTDNLNTYSGPQKEIHYRIFDTLLCKKQIKRYRMNRCFFVVWQPKQIHVSYIPFDNYYYTGTMVPCLKEWFFKKYLPLATLKANGLLVDNTLTVSAPILIDELMDLG
jgi:hypothetical protein